MGAVSKAPAASFFETDHGIRPVVKQQVSRSNSETEIPRRRWRLGGRVVCAPSTSRYGDRAVVVDHFHFERSEDIQLSARFSAW